MYATGKGPEMDMPLCLGRLLQLKLKHREGNRYGHAEARAVPDMCISLQAVLC